MREKQVEFIDIPSEPESDDEFCNSDDDIENYKLGPSDDSMPTLNETMHEDLLPEEEEYDTEEEEVWESKAIPGDYIAFTKNYGPNIPDTVNTPLDIFYCIFVNTYLTQLLNKQIYTRSRKIVSNLLLQRMN